MSTLLQPRQVGPGSWKRWVRQSLRLTGRVWLSLLVFSIAVGLTGGWVARQGLFLGFVVCVGAFGLWQAMLMHTAERAAAGKRVTVGDAWEGLKQFWQLPGGQAQLQLKVRLICSLLFYLAFLLLFILPLTWFVASNPEVAQDLSAATPAPRHPAWAWLLAMASGWVLVFFWSWVNQRGGMACSANMLVRRYGLDWDMALAVWERAVRLNHVHLRPLYWIFFAILLAMLWMPVLIFPLEVFWVCLVTVAGRDMFEQEGELAPQEARESQRGMALA